MASTARFTGTARRLWQGTGSRHLLIALGALLVLIVVVENLSAYRNSQLTEYGYLALAAGGLTVLTGVNGQLSLGHGAFMAVGGYTTALFLSRDDQPFPLLLIVVVAMLVTLVVGVAVGYAAAPLSGPYIAGATLALAVAVLGLPLYFSNTLGGEQGLRVIVPDIPGWLADAHYFVLGTDLDNTQYVTYLTWVTLIVIFVLLANLTHSRVGRRWAAVRDDDVSAELAGIDLGRARVAAFVVSTAAAGLAGAMLVLANRLAAPGSFTLELSLTLLTVVVLGGLGSLGGALVGAGLLAFLPTISTNVGGNLGLSDLTSAQLAPLVYGIVMVLVILLAPTGIAGSVRRARAAARARRGGSDGSASTDSTTDSTTDDRPTNGGRSSAATKGEHR